MRIKFIFYFFITLSFSTLYSQAPDVQWQKIYGGSGSDEIFDIRSTNDGNYIGVGWTSSNNGTITGNHGQTDMWIVKLDTSGNILWQKLFGGSHVDGGRSIRQTSDGGYIVIGSTNSTDGDITSNHGEGDMWVLKLDSSGNIQWQKTFGGTAEDGGESIEQTSDGGYIATGAAASSDGDVTVNVGQSDLWVIKMDATGNIQWQKTAGQVYDDYGTEVKQTSDGNYVVVGGNNSDNMFNTADFWVIKLNTTGNIIWQKTLGGSLRDYIFDIELTSDGGFITTGYSASTNGDITGNHGMSDMWVVKLDASGNIQWQRALGGSANDYGESVRPTLDGGYVIIGYTASSNGNVTGNNGMNDVWTVKLDASGNLQWQKALGGISSDVGRGILQVSNNGYIVAASTSSAQGDSPSFGGMDFWFVKLDSTLDTAESIKNNTPVLYPNPAKDFAYIDHLPGTETAIHIMDMSGRKVFQQKSVGEKIRINLDELIHGTYIIQAESNSEIVLTEKLMINK